VPDSTTSRKIHVQQQTHFGVVFTECRTDLSSTDYVILNVMDLVRALISKSPLTLGPYPTQFVDGALGPLFYFGNAPILGPYL